MLQKRTLHPGSWAAAALAAAAITCSATAQHTDFVLFGEPDAELNAVPAEQQFVHPITSPYYHENSFITTDIRAWYLYHQFDNDGLANGGIGGDVTVAAIQVRVALTDELQFVAYKDGFTWFEDSVINDKGWNDVAAGLKYNFYRDLEEQLSMAVGLGYQIDLGDSAVLQDDQDIRAWVSVDKGFDELHVGGTVNYLHAVGTESSFGNSDRLFWHLHADYYLCEWFSPVVELNGYHTVTEGTATLVFNGVDVANLGGGQSEDVVTLGFGGAFRVCEDVDLRAAYEIGLTDNSQLFGERLTLSLVYSF